MGLVVETYKIVERLPRNETFGLKLQMQRAAVSVPAKISEEHARGLTGEYLHHLAFAAGSLAELETHFEICVRLRHLKRDELASVFGLCDEISRMLQALIRRLKSHR